MGGRALSLSQTIVGFLHCFGERFVTDGFRMHESPRRNAGLGKRARQACASQAKIWPRPANDKDCQGTVSLSDASFGCDTRPKRSISPFGMKILSRPGPEHGRSSQESAENCVAERTPAHYSAEMARTDGYPLTDVVAGHARSIYRRSHDAPRRQNRAPDRRPPPAVAQEWTMLRSRRRANRFANGRDE